MWTQRGEPVPKGVVRTADGVSNAEFGDPERVPVVATDGVPSSRRERYFPDGDGYRRLGVRLIGVDLRRLRTPTRRL
jgi:hypothetical protein